MNNEMKIRAAKLLHHRKKTLQKGDPVSPPLVTATTYHLPDIQEAPFLYGRNSTPTISTLESQLSMLENAPTVAFSSGMAAISAALFAVLKSGGKLILPSDGYYVTRRLAHEFLATFGVDVIEIPTLSFENADFTQVDVVYIETPSNPGLDLVDITAISQRAHDAGAKVIVDNTTMTAFLQRPLDLGADLVVCADTKAPGGHSDALLGHVSGYDNALMARVSDWRRLSGSVPGGLEAWLVHRGIDTLELRLSRMCDNAEVIAQRLANHPKTLNIRYPGLASDAAHQIATRQMDRFGFLIGLTLASEKSAEIFLSRCDMLSQATSFGSVHTSAERRARWGDEVDPGFVRLSIGIEPVEALWTAISDAL